MSENRVICTGFDEKSWHPWGASWLISLLEYHNNITIIGFNLTGQTEAKIREKGVNLVSIAGEYSELKTLHIICDLAQQKEGMYAYWDAEVYFQEELDGIFTDDFVIASSPGFFAGPHQKWIDLKNILNVMEFFQDQDLHKFLTTYWNWFVVKVDDTWNFVDVANLRDRGKLTYKGVTQKVIHPCGPIKKSLESKNILFWERYKDLYQNFTSKKTFHKLVVNQNK